MLKLNLLFDFIDNSEHAQFAQAYYALMGCGNARDLVLRLAEVMQKSFVHGAKGDRVFVVTVPAEYHPIMDLLSHPIRTDEAWEPASLLSIKKFPVYKHGEGQYCILNWNFFYRHVYEGFLRDFHKRSGIAERYTEFIKYKSVVSHQVIEGRFFRAVLKIIFNGKHDFLHFDSDTTEPDCYARVGKYVYLFEMKDTDMRDELLTDFDYVKIIEDIESKFVESKKDGKSKPKAAKQLARDAKRVRVRDFTFDDMKGIRPNNLVIYPVAVYSGYHYSMPGINEYVNEAYERTSKEESKPMTMVSLDFLFLNSFDFVSMGYGRRLIRTIEDGVRM